MSDFDRKIRSLVVELIESSPQPRPASTIGSSRPRGPLTLRAGLARMALVAVLVLAGGVAGAFIGRDLLPPEEVPAAGPSTSTTSTINTVPPTSTSTSSTTTTTVPSTTTTSLLAGNWAELPVVTSGIFNMTLGWWDGSTWVNAEEGMALPVVGGEDYQIALLGTEGRTTTGSARVAGCDILFPSDFPGIQLADPELLSHPLQEGEQSAISGVAISAGWELTPHYVGDGEAHPDLETMAIDLLAERGFETDSVEIVQTVDANLDGGEFIETIVVVEETELSFDQSSAGYSLVFLVGSDSEPMVIDQSVILPGESGSPRSYRVGAVADLNGDGLMEVVLDGVAWESSWLGVYEMTDDGFVRRMGAGCGV